MEEEKFKMPQIAFNKWPLDLVLDYVLKLHHRLIREHGPRLQALVLQLSFDECRLKPVAAAYNKSLTQLTRHLLTEERELFPYLYQLSEAERMHRHISAIHGGSVSHPIKRIKQEHEEAFNNLLEVYEKANSYNPPADASEEYINVLKELRIYHNNLLEHMYLEDDLLFPRAYELEKKWVVANEEGWQVKNPYLENVK